MNLPRVRNFNFGICIFGTCKAFPNPSLRSFEVFHGLKRANTGLSCYRKNMLEHKFLYDLGMARLLVTFPDRFFFVDAEKHSKCIDTCILDFNYLKSKTIRPVLRVPNPRREHRQHRACFWSHIWIWPASGVRNLAFVYSAAAIFKVSSEIKNSVITNLTVGLLLRAPYWGLTH